MRSTPVGAAASAYRLRGTEDKQTEAGKPLWESLVVTQLNHFAAGELVRSASPDYFFAALASPNCAAFDKHEEMLPRQGCHRGKGRIQKIAYLPHFV